MLHLPSAWTRIVDFPGTMAKDIWKAALSLVNCCVLLVGNHQGCSWASHLPPVVAVPQHKSCLLFCHDDTAGTRSEQ